MSETVVLLINDQEMRTFEDDQSLIRFTEDELVNWEWLMGLMENVLTQAGSTTYREFISTPINNVLRGDGITTHKYVLGTAKQPYISSDSPNGKFIQRVRKTYGDAVALFAFLNLTNYNRTTSRRTNIIAAVMFSNDYTYEHTTAISLVAAYDGMDEVASSSKSDAMDVRLKEFEIHARHAQKIVDEQTSVISRGAKFIDAHLKESARSVTRKLRRREGVWNAYVKKAARSARESIKTAADSFDAAKDTLNSQIDLSASVKYWKDRRKRHARYKRNWFFGIILSMCFTFFAMYLYYQYVLSGSVFTSPEIIDAAKTAKTIITTEKANLSGQEIANYISHFLGATLLLTFLGIIVRISLRKFNTHSNCELEAEERVTFTKTYLALMRDGKLDSELDRKLVLETLFRPNSHSNPEISFSPPIELILKAIDRKPSA